MKFDFTRDEYEYLIDKLMLNEELSKILKMKIEGYSIAEMSIKLDMSESSINRRIDKLKKKIMRIMWYKYETELIIQNSFFMG